ncbi:MAG: DUF2914 domain-containing protein [Polyangiaceae bacterium]
MNRRWVPAVVLSSLFVAGCADRDHAVWAEDGVQSRADHAAASATAQRPAAAVAVVAPAAAPSTAPATPAPKKAEPRTVNDALGVVRLVTASGVEKRAPVGLSESFVAGEGRIYAFVEVENPTREAGRITVTFVSPSGVAHGPIELEVGASPRWRTWAYTRAASKPGTWQAVVQNESGKELAKTEFEVRASGETVQPGA